MDAPALLAVVAATGVWTAAWAQPAPTPVSATDTPSASVQPGSPAPESQGDILPAEAPTSTSQELDRIVVGSMEPRAFWDKPLVHLNEAAKQLEEKTGLKLGMALTMLLQQASGGPGMRTAASGDLDLMMRWTLAGKGTKNPGVLVFNTEYRWQMGDITPSKLNTQIFAQTATTNSFSERPVVVKELYWVQDLAEGAVRIGVGRADPENLTTAHKMQSANTFFQHKAFSGNPAVAFPGSGPALAAAYRTDDWYIGGGFINAYSNTTTIQIDSLFEEWDLFSFAEGGWTPTFQGLGAGRYRAALWNVDAKNRPGATAPSDWGVNFIADQELGKAWNAFFRYGWSDGAVTGIQNMVVGGVGFKGLSKDGLTGLAAGYIDYVNSAQHNETVAELFHRWQLTPQVQLTLGAEMIVNPANRPDDSVVGVFNVRLRMTF